MSTKVLFVCKKRISYGISYGLFNSARFVSNYLNEYGIESHVVDAVDANEIDKIVTQHNPQVVIIEAIWATPEKMEELLQINRHKQRVWLIRIHSKFPFLANEGTAFPWMLGYRNVAERYGNLIIAPNAECVAHDLAEAFGMTTVFLPNIYQPSAFGTPVEKDKDKRVINVGCFGAIRPMKNTLTQAIAAVKFGDKRGNVIHFHINAARCEQRGDQVLHNLEAFFEGQEEHKLIKHEWVSYPEFVKIVCQMDIGMQVSYSETFNIVAADFVSHDIPLVGSKEIDWLPTMFTADPNSTHSIAEALELAWSYPGYLLRKLAKMQLNMHNSNAKKIWVNFLEPYICA
jgi:hypothetical protein